MNQFKINAFYNKDMPNVEKIMYSTFEGYIKSHNKEVI